MNSGESWRMLFESWPEAVPREGLLVTIFNETIPFVNYLISDRLLVIERDKPDTFGARKVILDYGSISAVKITSPMEFARLQVMGFQPPM